MIFTRSLLTTSLFFLATAQAAQPVITQFSVPTSGILMGDALPLIARADGQGDGRPLAFRWSIVSDGTGTARLLREDTSSAFLELWWGSAATAAQKVGAQVTVQLEVTFSGATAEDQPAVQSGTVQVTALNSPPVPRIAGNLGTPEDRIASGRSVQLNSYHSTDPEGNSFRSDWGWGRTRGGRFLRPVVMYGSEGALASFTVPDMTSEIDQTVILYLRDGLHSVEAEAVVYLKPSEAAPPPTVDGAPVLTVTQSTVTVPQGQTAYLQAVGTDAQGDDLEFTWVFMRTATTTSSSMVTSRRTSGTTWVSTLSYPTSSLAPGTYQFSVRAAESRLIDANVSDMKFVTLVVAGEGGTGLDQDPRVCGQNNPAPSLSSISPDPRIAPIQVRGGETTELNLLFRDYSEVPSVLGGTKKGIEDVTWDFGPLTQLGVEASSQLTATPDPFEARATVTLNPGQNASGTVDLVAVATDVEGCTNTVSFQLTVERSAQTQNTKPSAKIRYRTSGAYSGVIPTGTRVNVSQQQVEVDASQSTDDGGTAGLRYSWAISGPGTLSTSSGVATTVTINEGAAQAVSVTLTVRDQESLADFSTVLFDIAPPNDPPVARIRYDAGDGLSEAIADGTTVEVTSGQIQLDGGRSSDDGGLENLTFSWSEAGAGTLSSTTGQSATLTIPEGTTSLVTVTLTVRDQGSLSAFTTIGFLPVAPNQAPQAAIEYDHDGDGLFSGPFTEDSSAGSSAGTIELRASDSTDDGGAERLSYTWSIQGSSGAALSRSSGVETELTVPGAAEGSATVTLTVTDEHGASDTVSVTFSFEVSESIPSAQIAWAPQVVESGEDFGLEGSASGGSGSETYRYVWAATSSDGEPVEVYSTGNRARIFAPVLEELGEARVSVSLTVYQGALASEPALAEIRVTSPTLYFAQLAVGNINEALRFETCIVLVNNSETPAEGWITLVNNSFGESWSVRVNGEYQSEFFLEIPTGGAAKFVLSGEDVEVGWMSMVSNVRLTGHLFYQVVESGSERVVREVPILPSTGQGFRTALDTGNNSNLALALVNLGDETVQFKLLARNSSGGTIETREFTLEPGEHTARFLSELFDGGENSLTPIPDTFPGGTLVVQVVSGTSELAAAIMKTDEGLPLSILPIGVW